MKFSILSVRICLLAVGLVLAAEPVHARPPWAQRTAEGPALARILAQSRGQMSDADREQLRRDLNAAPRGRGRNDVQARDRHHMTPEQRESLRRDMRDANRQLDRKSRRGRNGDRNRDRGSDRR